MPRYEKTGKKGVEVFDIRISKTTVSVAQGRVGAKPKQKSSKYGSDNMAESRFRTAIAGARKRGYAHVATLRSTAENPALEQALFEHPDDDTHRLVYGDWLLEQGDPRGELIAVQHQLRTATGAAATKLRKRERALLADHSSLLYGTLDEILHERTHVDRAHVRADWRLGFFDEVELRLSEGGMPDYPKLSEAVRQLSTLHSARFVRKLILGGSAANYKPSIKQLVASGWPKTLRSFVITGQLWGEYTPVEHEIDGIDGFYRAHPDLEELTLYLNTQSPGSLALPKLRHLALWTNQLSKAQLQSVVDASWPALRSLEFEIGSSHKKLVPGDVAALFDAKKLPALDTLRIGRLPGESFAGALGVQLRTSTLSDRLRSIVIANSDGVEVTAFTKALGSTRVPVTTAERET